MAYEFSNYSVKVSLVAGADLSSHQYKFVKLNSSGQAILCAATTDVPVGVLQNTPTSGQEAEVLVVGGTKLVAAASISGGNGAIQALATDASGLAAAVTPGTDTTRYAVGRCITVPGAANDIFTAVIDCSVPQRAS